MDKWKQYNKNKKDLIKKAGYDKEDSKESFTKGVFNRGLDDKDEKKEKFPRIKKLFGK